MNSCWIYLSLTLGLLFIYTPQTTEAGCCHHYHHHHHIYHGKGGGGHKKESKEHEHKKESKDHGHKSEEHKKEHHSLTYQDENGNYNSGKQHLSVSEYHAQKTREMPYAPADDYNSGYQQKTKEYDQLKNSYNYPVSENNNNGYSEPTNKGYNEHPNIIYNAPSNAAHNVPLNNGYNGPLNNDYNIPYNNGYNSATNYQNKENAATDSDVQNQQVMQSQPGYNVQQHNKIQHSNPYHGHHVNDNINRHSLKENYVQKHNQYHIVNPHYRN